MKCYIRVGEKMIPCYGLLQEEYLGVLVKEYPNKYRYILRDQNVTVVEKLA